MAEFAGDPGLGLQQCADFWGAHRVRVRARVGLLSHVGDAERGLRAGQHDLERGDVVMQDLRKRRMFVRIALAIVAVLARITRGVSRHRFLFAYFLFFQRESKGVVFYGFVDAGRAFRFGQVEDVFAGLGAVLPQGTVQAAALEAAGVEAVDDGIPIAQGCADAFGAAMKPAPPVPVRRAEFAGGPCGGVCAADAAVELLFGVVDFLDPLVVPFVGAGGAEGGLALCAHLPNPF